MMNRRHFLSSVISLGAFGFTGIARAQSVELAVIVHPGVPAKALGEGEIESIFLTTRLDWSGGARIIPFNLPPKTPHRVEFDESVLHMNPDEVARYWIDRRVRGGNRPPRQVPNPKLMTAVVARLPGAIGYVPRSAADGSVRIVASIKNGRVAPP